MMTGVEFPARQLTIASLIAVLVSIFLWSGTYARITDANVQIDKDYLHLYVCGAEIIHPSLHEQQTELVEHLKEVVPPELEHYVYRAQLRASYCDNYPFTSLSMYLAGRLQIYFGINDPAKDFPAFVLSSMRWGMGLSGAVLGIFCLIAVFWAARGPLMLAALGAIVLAGVLYIEMPPPTLSWMLYDTDPTAPFKVLRHIIKLGLLTWLHATVPFTAFSVFPRSLCAMLAFVAFILRWSGRGSLAYWVPILICFVHQSEAPIVLVTMICCDLLLRPQVLASRPYILPIAIAVIIIVLRERMLSILGVSWLALGLLGGLIALIAVVVLIPRLRFSVQSLWLKTDKWRLKLSQWPTSLVEALIILAMWFAILLVCFAFRHDQAYRVIYLWSELPSRFVGLFQLPVFAGLMYPVWVAVFAKCPRNVTRLAFAVISCLALILAVNQWKGPWVPTGTLVSNSRQFDEPVSKGYSGVRGGSFSKIETPWYYIMVRKAFLGGDGIAEYFAKH